MMVSTSAIAPKPVSLHIRVLKMQGISMYPKDFRISICLAVNGCSYILVFIAGQNNKGFLRSQARTIEQIRLSHKPLLILARVFASGIQIIIIFTELRGNFINKPHLKERSKINQPISPNQCGLLDLLAVSKSSIHPHHNKLQLNLQLLLVLQSAWNFL